MPYDSAFEGSAKVVKGSIIIFLDLLCVAILSIAYAVVIARLLGPEGYGMVATGLALFNFLVGTASYGLSGALTRHVAKYMALGSMGAVKEILRISMKYLVLLAFVFSFAVMVLAGPIATNVYGNPGLTNLFRIVALIIPLGALFYGFIGIFQGFQRMKYIFYIDFTSMALRLLIAVIFVLLGYFATGVLIGVGLGLLFSLLLGFGLLYKTLPKGASREKEKTPELSKEIVSFALPAGLGSIMGVFIASYGTLLLGSLAGMQNVGYYSAALGITLILTYLPTAIGTALFPAVSEFWTRGDRKSLINAAKASVKLISFCLIPLVVILLIFPEFIIKLFFGVEFITGANVLRILAVALLMGALGGVNSSIFSGVGKPQTNMKVYAVAVAIAVASITPLARAYGIMGAGAGFLLVQIVFACLEIFLVARRIGITYPIGIFWRPTLAAGAMLAFIIPTRLLATHIVHAVLIGIVGVFIYALALLKLGGLGWTDVEVLRRISADMGKPRFFEGMIDFLSKFIKNRKTKISKFR
jgi:stage V sporulation protein B